MPAPHRHKLDPARRRLLRLARRLGVPIQRRDDIWPAVYDGRAVAIGAQLDNESFAHECGHWLVAHPRNRRLPNYGMPSVGLTPKHLRRRAVRRVYPGWTRSAEEDRAILASWYLLAAVRAFKPEHDLYLNGNLTVNGLAVPPKYLQPMLAVAGQTWRTLARRHANLPSRARQTVLAALRAAIRHNKEQGYE